MQKDVRKTYWKSVALPSLAVTRWASVINFNKNEINKLQAIENSVYRTIIEAKTYTVTEEVKEQKNSSGGREDKERKRRRVRNNEGRR